MAGEGEEGAPGAADAGVAGEKGFEGAEELPLALARADCRRKSCPMRNTSTAVAARIGKDSTAAPASSMTSIALSGRKRPVM